MNTSNVISGLAKWAILATRGPPGNNQCNLCRSILIKGTDVLKLTKKLTCHGFAYNDFVYYILND